jgi:hypothetical protein
MHYVHNDFAMRSYAVASDGAGQAGALTAFVGRALRLSGGNHVSLR